MLHGGNHTCRGNPFTYYASHKDMAVSNLDQSTDFHCSNTNCLCFFTQASLFFLLVSFSSGFFAAIWPCRPDSRSLLWTVDVEMCLLLELCEAFIWAAISEAGNSNELILCNRDKYGSFSVAVLVKDSFIIVLDGFCHCTWRNIQSSWNELKWAVLAIIWTWSFSVYHPYLVTTQGICSNALRRKEILQIPF